MPEQYFDENGARAIIYRELDENTVVYDKARHTVIMRIKGVVVLPVGAEIELTQPNVEATVIGMKLLAGTQSRPMTVRIDVEVPEKYYSDAELRE